MKRRSRPPTLTSIRRACQWAGQMRGAFARLQGDTGMRISASPRASCWTISWRRLSRARISQWRCVPAACQSNGTPPRSTLGQTGSRVILAAQLRCQAQFAAVHGAEMASTAFRGCVCPSGKWADLRPGREAMLVAAAAQFDSGILRGVRRHQTTPSTASTRSGWRTFTAGRLQAWVSRANSSAKAARPGAGGFAR